MKYYYVYVLKSKSSGKIYIGQTDDIEKRLRQHNDRTFGKRSYTKLHGSLWKLVYSEKFLTRAEALYREKVLKSHKGRDWLRENFLSP